MNLAWDWYKNGPTCLNCGERVPDAQTILGEQALIFHGMCKSMTCQKLPPGGNPFHIILSKGGEEE